MGYCGDFTGCGMSRSCRVAFLREKLLHRTDAVELREETRIERIDVVDDVGCLLPFRGDKIIQFQPAGKVTG